MKESLVYLNILQYIKLNGITDFEQLFTDLEHFNLSENNILNQLIISNEVEKLNHLIKNNGKLIGFLRSLRCESADFLSKEFKYFIKIVEINIDSLDAYIDNARQLVRLSIDTIDFTNISSSYSKQVELYYDSSNIINSYINDKNEKIYFKVGNLIASRVIYTDGITNLVSVNSFSGQGTLEKPFSNCRIGNDENYRLDIKRASFILESENHENNKQLRYIMIPNFGFNASKLPSKEELESYSEPEYVKQYKKTFK